MRLFLAILGGFCLGKGLRLFIERYKDGDQRIMKKYYWKCHKLVSCYKIWGLFPYFYIQLGTHNFAIDWFEK